MKRKTNDLIQALNLRDKEHVATVGGGGKSTLGLKLAQALTAGGKSVVATTTTKVWHKEGRCFPCLVLCPPGEDLVEAVCKSLSAPGAVFLAREILNSGKLQGITPKASDLVFQCADVDHVIVEADGAAGLPVKAPVGNEPVIPVSATLVIAVMGLELMGRPLDPGTIFRFSQFERLTGLKPGGPLDPALLIHLFRSSEGLFKGAPASARRMVFLNKMDQCSDPAAAQHLVSLLLDPSTGADRVVMGSLHENTYTFFE